MNIKIVDTLEEFKRCFDFAKDGVFDAGPVDLIENETDLFERKRRDAEVLTCLASNAAGHGLELGTSFGNGSYNIARNLAEGRLLYTINILPEQRDSSELVTHYIPRKEIGSFYRRQNSRNIVQIYANTLNWTWPTFLRDLGFVFVDACHDTHAVYTDSKNIFERIREGGFICWHDFGPLRRNQFPWIHAVMQGVENFLAEIPGEHEIINLKNSWMGVMRKTRVPHIAYSFGKAGAVSAAVHSKPTDMSSLRYLIAYTAHSEERHLEELEDCARIGSYGFNTEGFCVSVPVPGHPHWFYDRLDDAYRRSDPALLKMYERLAEKLSNKDVLVLQTGAMLHPDFVRSLKTYNVYICADDPDSSQQLSMPVARHFDFAFTRNVACVDMYFENGCLRAGWLPAGVQESILRQTDPERLLKEDRPLDTVMFCERVYGISDRAQRIERLLAAFPQTYIRGMGWPGGYVGRDEMRGIYRQAKIGWNLHNSLGPCNSRLFALPAFGVLQICDNKTNLGRIFQLDKEVVGFDSIEECIEKTRHYLKHPDEARAIALQGWKRVLADYTEEKIWRRMLATIQKDCFEKLQGEKQSASFTLAGHPDSELKLRLKCGADRQEGYLNIDDDPLANCDLCFDLKKLGLIFGPNSISEILMVHSLNDFTLWQARAMFRQFHRLLTPHGPLVLETANLENLLQKILQSDGKLDDHLEGVRALHGFGLDHLKQQKAYPPNKFSWSSWHLKQELESAGFEDVEILPPQTHSSWRDMRIVARKKKRSQVPEFSSITPSSSSSSAILNQGEKARLLEKPKGKVLFLLDPVMGHVTAHLRGLLFKELFEANGWHVRFVDVRKESEEAILQMADGFDLIYLLKIASLRLVEQLKKASSAKIVFDLTDALWKPHHREHGWQDLEEILKKSDAIFSENEFICSYGRKYNSRVYSIPACTQVERFDAIRPGIPPRNDGKIRIGWIGSTGTVRALASIQEPLEHLFAKYSHLELRIVGCGDAAQIPKFQHVRYTVLQQYNEEDMIRETLNLDIGIFPPPFDLEDYAIRGALKGMIYMTAGIPAVCQDAGDPARVIQDGVNGMLAQTPKDWEEKLDRLIQSPELRKQIGSAALASMRREHSLTHVFEKLSEALLDVIQRPSRDLDKGDTQNQASTDLKKTPASSLPPSKPRLLLIADVPHWIFERHAQTLQRLLGEEFEFELIFRNQPFDEDRYDLVYPLEWNLVDVQQIRNPRKYVTGIRSFISWAHLEFPLFTSFLKAHFQKIHVVSQQLLELFQPHLPNLAYVTHGVDTRFFSPTTRPDQSGTRLRLGWAGNRNTPVKKGFADIIEPLGKLPGVELVFCGYNDRNLTLEEMRRFYDSIDVYVCASDFEGNNNSLMEAASMKRAIVTTSNGTVPEYLEHGKSAWIVERKLEDFVKAVAHLRDNPALRVALGERAREAVMQSFDWNMMARDYAKFFREALEIKSPSDISSPSLSPSANLGPLLKQIDEAIAKGNLDSAQELLRQAQAISPEAPEVLILHGKILLGLKKAKEAYREFARIAQLFPNHAPAHFHLGLTQLILKRGAEAENSIRKALELQPHHPEAHILLGHLFSEKGEDIQAISHFLEALRYHQENAGVLLALGEAYFRSGNLKSARAVFQRILWIDPTILHARKKLQNVCDKLQARLTPQTSPEISVIVPTHNRPDLLELALKSILSQTYQDFEIIVVNDAGSDVSGLIEQLNTQSNIIYIQHSENKGLAAARNTGIHSARGKYIAYLDDDDTFYLDHLETLIQALKSGKHQVAYTDALCALQKSADGTFVTTQKVLLHSFELDRDLLLVENLFPVLCFMHEKSCFEAIGLFDESLRRHEDWDLWIRMSRKYDFLHIKKITAEFTTRINDQASMRTGSKQEFLKTYKIIYERYREFAKGNPLTLERQTDHYRKRLAESKPPIRVLAFVRDLGSQTQIRVSAPLETLHSQRIVQLTMHNLSNPNELSLKDFDIALFQRTDAPQLLPFMELLRRAGTITAYEIDDLLWDIPETNPFRAHYEQPAVRKTMRTFLRSCHHVLTTTELLAKELRPLNPNVWVLPNQLMDTIYQPPKGDANRGKTLRIGYSGSITHLADLEQCVPALERILAKYPVVELVFITCIPPQLIGHPRCQLLKCPGEIRQHAQVLAEAKLDIALAPLLPNRFNECKSDIKFLEYARVKAAGIYSNIGPYAATVQHMKTGLLVNSTDPSEWFEKIEMLVQKRDLLEEIQKNAADYVNTYRLMSQKAFNWYEVFEKMLEQKETKQTTAKSLVPA